MKPKLTNADFARAAKRLRVDVPAIKAVAEVESLGNGFYADGFPVILYERHIFRKFTQGRYNRTHPELSGPAGNYGAAGMNQRRKFSAAFALNPTAAMKSCSWGKFQIMGFNHAICGYSTVDAFVDAMKESEGKHLDAFVEFVISNKLDRHLRNLDWAAFAKGYNGAGYKKNNYDVKMARAYTKYLRNSTADSNGGNPHSPANSTQDKEDIRPNPPDSSSSSDSVDSLAQLVPVPAEVITVPQISAAQDPVPAAEPESVMTKIGNKANAAYTMLSGMGAGVIAWFSGASTEIILGVVAIVIVLGGLYMIINWRRHENKEKRDHDAKVARDLEEIKLKAQREQQAFELQKLTMESAMRKDLNMVTIAAPPPTEMANSDSVT